ncbi:hypothetical protein PVK06_026987 [Gossypium arboreum]|uniref:Uncharacterized protein n=1 Tax=Gossypium arboreum TaxID=29729 RepID=A0ABR0NZ61_GOSAR|nr:hypothetical protein PVK06_026987 [Gossypium arboreum]
MTMNVFQSYLEGYNFKGWRPSDNVEVARSLGALLESWINHSPKDSSSETNSISHKINKAMDIDSLISGSHKKCKTTAGVVHINSASEEDKSNTQLERRSIGRIGHAGPIAAVVEALNSPKRLAVAEIKIEGVACEVAIERQSNEAVQAELGALLLLTVLEATVFILRALIYHFYPVNFNRTVGNFALANYIRGYDFYPTSLNITAKSFSLSNYVEGYDSSLTSLNITVGSFALANCVGGCDSSPASLNKTVGSFALANYVGGYGFYPRSLNMA